jgi:hypothetical protein
MLHKKAFFTGLAQIDERSGWWVDFVSRHATYGSLCSGVAMITDGQWALPIDHELWTNKELTNTYVSNE